MRLRRRTSARTCCRKRMAGEAEDMDILDEDDIELVPGTGEEASSSELYEHRRVVADSGQNPVRVDKFLMDHLRDTSRNRIQKPQRPATSRPMARR